MKTKLLLLLASSILFVAGCSNQTSTSTSPSTEPTSTTPISTIEYLTFVEKGKMRIDLFDVDVQFSYGNAALSEAINTADIKSVSKLTANQASTAEKQYHFIFFGEKEGRNTFKYFGSSGDELLTVLDLNTVKNFFDPFDSERGYIAISTGADAKWTKNLNAKFDAYITAELK